MVISVIKGCHVSYRIKHWHRI